MRILSLDGGGIKGLLSALILNYIETICETPIVDLFDIVSGASTGAIITGMLVAPKEDSMEPKYDTNDLVRVYRDDIPKLLTGSYLRDIRTIYGLYDNRFSITKRNQYLENYLGDLKLADTLRPVLIPANNVKTHRPYIFKTRHAKQHESRNVELRDVIIAATSAPMMYYPHKVGDNLYSDCLSLQNPVMVAVSEVLKGGTPASDIVVLSIGTGYVEDGFSGSIYGISYAINSVWASMNSQKQSADYYARHILDSNKYLRIDFPCPEEHIGTYDIRKENMDFLEKTAMRLFIQMAPKIGRLLKHLRNPEASTRFDERIDMWIACHVPLPSIDSKTDKEAI